MRKIVIPNMPEYDVLRDTIFTEATPFSYEMVYPQQDQYHALLVYLYTGYNIYEHGVFARITVKSSPVTLLEDALAVRFKDGIENNQFRLNTDSVKIELNDKQQSVTVSGTLMNIRKG